MLVGNTNFSNRCGMTASAFIAELAASSLPRVNELKHSRINAAYGNLRHQQLWKTGHVEQIRTYNYIESRCADHRTGAKTRNIDGVLKKGQFELLFEQQKKKSKDKSNWELQEAGSPRPAS